MSWWKRYRAWQLQSRMRYAVTELGLRAAILWLLAWVVAGSPPAAAGALVFGIFLVLGIFVYGWVYYPRVKAKS